MKKEDDSDKNSFDVTLKKQGDNYVFNVSELNLSVSDNDISRGFEKISIEKERLINKYKEAQFDIPLKQGKKPQSDIPLKQEKKSKSDIPLQKESYEGYVIKAGIVSLIFCLFFIGSVYIASNIVASKVQTLLLRQIPDAAPRELSAQINTLAQRIQDTSPQNREKFRQSLQVILTELKPVFEALNTEKGKTDSSLKKL